MTDKTVLSEVVAEMRRLADDSDDGCHGTIGTQVVREWADRLAAPAVSDDFRQRDLDAIARYTHPPEDSRDAARLNFLLAEHAVVETDGSNNWRVKREWMPDLPEAYGPYATSERAAIDAAMKVQP